MKVTVIGSGVFGSALAKVLVNNGQEVLVWTEKQIDINEKDGYKISNSYEEVLKDCHLVFVLTGSTYIKSVLEGMKSHLKNDTILVIGTKGLLEDGKFISEEIEKTLPNNRYAILSGPTFAKDVGALEPVGFTLASKTKEVFNPVKEALSNTFLEYTNDVIGTEMSGSLKNAYAIGSGMLNEFGHSTRCLYITKVIYEIKEILKQMKAKEETSLSLAGIGDLILTCTSLNSRNFTFGTLQNTASFEEIQKYLNNNTVEGYENLKSYVKLFKEKNIDAPILFVVNSIIEGNEKIDNLIKLLLKK